VSPALAGAKIALEKQRTADILAHRLDTRPTKDELEERGVIKQMGVSPALAGAKIALEKQRTADLLTRRLEKRPSLTDLQDKGIVREGEVRSPIVEGAKAQLRRQATSDALTKGLEARPDAATLVERGILAQSATSEPPSFEEARWDSYQQAAAARAVRASSGVASIQQELDSLRGVPMSSAAVRKLQHDLQAEYARGTPQRIATERKMMSASQRQRASAELARALGGI